MMKYPMTKSEVVFSEDAHTYLRGETRLSGITSLIHDVLLLGVYPDASEFVKNVQIPRAGYYGSCVHKSIQMYEDMGIEVTQFPEKEHPTAGTLPAQDVSDDLAMYKVLKPRKCWTNASEFTVDYGMFASQIDAVWMTDEGRIYLCDFKTNNLNYYPGGDDGLKEYLSWQLSCYAFMFEQQTNLKVTGLVGFWLRKGSGELWEIPRRSDEEVKRLLDTEVVLTDNGFVYHNPEMQVVAAAPEEVAPVASSTDLAVPLDVISAITALLKAEKAAKAMKERLRELMEEAGVTKWECPEFTATIGKPSETTTFDSKSFKKDHPDLYKQYQTTTTRKGSFTQKLK